MMLFLEADCPDCQKHFCVSYAEHDQYDDAIWTLEAIMGGHSNKHEWDEKNVSEE
jgi:hypothetical protein